MLTQNLLLAGDDAYNLTKSLRFRSSASAYLNRTPTSSGSQQKFTWAGWVKRGKLSTTSYIYISDTSGAAIIFWIYFNSSDQLQILINGSGTSLTTTQVFRDPSAWYNIQVSVDTTQATSSNRILVYVNGSQVTAFSATNYYSINDNVRINTSSYPSQMMAYSVGATYTDGYLAEINFIDGQQLTPSSFGSTNALTGVWQPKKYAGTYGTNGFYLPFTDVATTSGSNAGLGKDFSGNGNYWNTNNISVTTGSTYDSMTDVPTLTSATTANYCVLNPLDYDSSTFTLSNANLTFAGARTASGSYYTRSTVAVTSGKWYWEVTPTDVGAGPNLAIGIQSLPSALTGGGSLTLNGYAYGADGLKWNNSGTASYGATWTNGDVIGIAYDATAGTITFYKNNTSQGTAFTGITAGTYTPIIEMSTGGVARTVAGSANFGQRPFSYTPPTGFVALNTFNLPNSTIVKGNTVMDATLYTGNDTGGTNIVNASGFLPDFVWIKNRNNTAGHSLFDSVRGVSATYAPFLQSQATGAENNFNGTVSDRTLTSLNSNGFTLGADQLGLTVNGSGRTYVGWQWQAGQGTTSSNTDGTITSTVSVNPSAGFSVVTYTGNGTGGRVGHGLGVAPKMMIVKQRGSTTNWAVYHQSLPSTFGIAGTQVMYLNATTANTQDFGPWDANNTEATKFSVGLSTLTNASGGTYVAYCWSEIAGFSKFGSYTGNGSADGTFVYTGFRPKFVMFKGTSAGYSWGIMDSARGPINVINNPLVAEGSNAELSGFDVDFLSNGFKFRSSSSSSNGSGITFIYMAFAENPFRNALAR